MNHVACESKLRSVDRSYTHPFHGNWLVIRRAFCRAFSAAIKSRDSSSSSNNNIDQVVGTKKLSWLNVGLVISRSLVQFLTGALRSVLGQDSLFHIASVYPAVKWVPSINKAVLRACALHAASCCGISLGGLKWFPCVQAC